MLSMSGSGEGRGVRVRLFARAKDVVGSEVVELQLAEGATVADVRRRLAAQYPDLRALLEHSAFAVNEEFADDSVPLPCGAEVALLPPVSGG